MSFMSIISFPIKISLYAYYSVRSYVKQCELQLEKLSYITRKVICVSALNLVYFTIQGVDGFSYFSIIFIYFIF